MVLKNNVLNKGIKIGVFGVGYLGRIHLECLRETKFDICGFYDPDTELSAKVQKETGIPFIANPESLMNMSDAIDIVAPTPLHFEIALSAIEKGKHVFIEKPICQTPEEARILICKAKEMKVIGQVGHVERYNPAFVSVVNKKITPGFIEAHRLSSFSSRNHDVSVVLDLMIHDLDLILFLVNSEIVDIKANGIKVIHDTIDISNARLTFRNGCVANITASRISMKDMRKVRIFQKDAYISVDFLMKKTQIITMSDHDPNISNQDGWVIGDSTFKKVIHVEELASQTEDNAILAELNEFCESISFDRQPGVTLEMGAKALELAHEIENIINEV